MKDPDARERAVLSLLNAWPWDLGGVVIGGYAVIAYGPVRYSDDVDVLLPVTAADRVRSWLHSLGFALEKHSVPKPQNYEGQAERYTTEEVTLDLLIGAVRDRVAGVDVPEAWISKKPRKVQLSGFSSKTGRTVPIARPEALWALKLQAGRGIDVADLFAISDVPVDTAEVTSLFVRLASPSLRAKLSSVTLSLGGSNLFTDSLSRRQLGSPRDPANIRRWERFVARVNEVVRPIVATAEPQDT